MEYVRGHGSETEPARQRKHLVKPALALKAHKGNWPVVNSSPFRWAPSATLILPFDALKQQPKISAPAQFAQHAVLSTTISQLSRTGFCGFDDRNILREVILLYVSVRN